MKRTGGYGIQLHKPHIYQMRQILLHFTYSIRFANDLIDITHTVGNFYNTATTEKPNSFNLLNLR